MKKINIFFIFILVLVSFCSFVSAKVVLESPSTDGLSITYPIIETYKIDDDIIFYFHVYNSTGFIVDNTSLICNFHLYDVFGNHLHVGNLSFDNEENEFYINVNSGNFTNTGIYSFLLNCANGEAGYISKDFEITRSGIQPPILAFVVMLGFIIFMLIITSIILNENHIFLKIINVYYSFIFSYLLISSFVTLNYIFPVYKYFMYYITTIIIYFIVYGSFWLLHRFDFVGNKK